MCLTPAECEKCPAGFCPYRKQETPLSRASDSTCPVDEIPFPPPTYAVHSQQPKEQEES